MTIENINIISAKQIALESVVQKTQKNLLITKNDILLKFISALEQPIDPNKKYTHDQAMRHLSAFYDVSSQSRGKNEDGSSKAEGRTTLHDIRGNTIIGAKLLGRVLREKRGYNGKLTITGGTESASGHSKAHLDGRKLDIRSKDAGGQLLIQKYGLVFGTKKSIYLYLNLPNGSEYRIRAEFYYHGSTKKNLLGYTRGTDTRHLDIIFHPIEKVQ